MTKNCISENDRPEECRVRLHGPAVPQRVTGVIQTGKEKAMKKEKKDPKKKAGVLYSVKTKIKAGLAMDELLKNAMEKG